MSTTELISLIVTLVCLIGFCLFFTLVYRHYVKSNSVAIKNGEEDANLLEENLIKRKHQKSAGRKALRIGGKVLSYAVLAVVLAGFAFALYGRISNNDIPIGNTTAMVIATGSMSERNNDYLDEYDLNNQFNQYDIIGVTKYSSEDDVKLYDVVAFKNSSNTTIVHRIIYINEPDANGVVSYITRGDSNSGSDSDYKDGASVLYYSNIIGYYNGFRIRWVGLFVFFLQSNSGIMTVIALLYCLIMFDNLSNKLSKVADERSDKILKLIGYDTKHYERACDPPDQRLFLQSRKFVFQAGELVDEDEFPCSVPDGQILRFIDTDIETISQILEVDSGAVGKVEDPKPYLTPPKEEEEEAVEEQ